MGCVVIRYAASPESSWVVEQLPVKKRMPANMRHDKKPDVFMLFELLDEKKRNYRSGSHSDSSSQMDACRSGMKILASMAPPCAMQEMSVRKNVAGSRDGLAVLLAATGEAAGCAFKTCG